jgi:membrane protease YdiL (CAAX protease family)
LPLQHLSIDLMEVSPPLLLLLATVIFLSLASCFYLLWRLLRYGQVLAYEPRQRVPWGLWGVLVAVALTTLSVVAAATSSPTAGEGEPPATADEFARQMLSLSAVFLSLSAALLLVLGVMCRANWVDLGLPTTRGQFAKDVGLGLVLGMASFLPVYVLQSLAIVLLGVDASHPILDRIQQSPDLAVLLGAMLAATIVAPLFEEIVYRLLLMGALERWEDQAIGWHYSRRPVEDDSISFQGLSMPIAESDDLTELEATPAEAPLDAPGVVVGLSHGWFPILVSALLFSLAHLGQGPSPIPLFAFSLIVAYAYQRTHRIVPCMVAHLVFNGLSIAILAVSLLASSE